MDGIPFPFIGYSMEQITTVIDTRPYIQTKLKGIRCYASQINPDMTPYLQNDFDPAANPWFWQETFILARTADDVRLVWDDEKENDLFAGVR